MRKRFSLLTMALILIFSITVFAETLDDGQYVIGNGWGDPNQSYGNGLLAAKLDAFRNAAMQAGELPITSEMKMKDNVASDNTVKAKLDVVIRGGRIIEEGKNATGYYAVVRVPIWGVKNSVASAVFDQNQIAQSLPNPIFPDPIATSSGYTGLIVDCRGLNKKLETAMSPVIKNGDSNQPIYGAKNLNYDKIVEQGMASYVTSPTDGASRAGSNPLIVKAVRVDGTIPCDPVVSATDADKILSANQGSHFLEKCAVVFVK